MVLEVQTGFDEVFVLALDSGFFLQSLENEDEIPSKFLKLRKAVTTAFSNSLLQRLLRIRVIEVHCRFPI